MSKQELEKKIDDEPLGTQDADTDDPATDDPSADPDTETDDAPSDTETDPAPIDEYDKEFKNLGLNRQFQNPLDALRRIPDYNRHADQLHKRNLVLETEIADLRRPKPEPVDPEKFREDFETNPMDTLKDHGVARTEDVATMQLQMDEMKRREKIRDFADSISDKPELANVRSSYMIGQKPPAGLNPYWDEIQALLVMSPGLEMASPTAIVNQLFPEAKKRVLARKKPPVKKVPDESKSAASSTAPGRKPAKGKADYSKMTADEIKADAQKKRSL